MGVMKLLLLLELFIQKPQMSRCRNGLKKKLPFGKLFHLCWRCQINF